MSSHIEEVDFSWNGFPDFPFAERNSIGKRLDNTFIFIVNSDGRQTPLLFSMFRYSYLISLIQVVQPEHKLFLIDGKDSILQIFIIFIFLEISYLLFRTSILDKTQQRFIVFLLPLPLSILRIGQHPNLKFKSIVIHSVITLSHSLEIISTQSVDVHQQTVVVEGEALGSVSRYHQLNQNKYTFDVPSTIYPKLHIG